MIKATARPIHLWAITIVAAMPAMAEAKPASNDLRLPRLTTGRLALERKAAVFPFSSSLTEIDRLDLASVRSRTAMLSAGPVDIQLSAHRAANVAQRADLPFGIDKWSVKGMGVTAEIPVGPTVSLRVSGDYARMTRRLQVVQVNPYRLGTTLVRAGLALDFVGGERLGLDYVNVSRSSSHDTLTRLAETVGGAPLTGHGPELSFATTTGKGRGGTDWRLSLASMQRPERDLGLSDSTAMRHDARATMNFSLHF